jgi:hypothetical protein
MGLAPPGEKGQEAHQGEGRGGTRGGAEALAARRGRDSSKGQHREGIDESSKGCPVGKTRCWRSAVVDAQKMREGYEELTHGSFHKRQQSVSDSLWRALFGADEQKKLGRATFTVTGSAARLFLLPTLPCPQPWTAFSRIKCFTGQPESWNRRRPGRFTEYTGYLMVHVWFKLRWA